MLQLKASTPQHNLNIRLSNRNSQFSCNPITPSQLPNLTSDLVGVVVFHTARCHAAKHHITNEWWPLRPPHAWPQALARRVASKRASSRHFRRPRRKTFPKNVYSDLEPFSAGVNPSVDHSLWKLSIEITWLVVVCSSWRSSAVSRPLNRVQLVKCRCNTLFQLSSSVNKTQQQQKKQKKNQLIIRNKTPDSLTRHNCPGQMTSVNVGFRCRYWRHSYWSNWKFFRDSICFYLFVGVFFFVFSSFGTVARDSSAGFLADSIHSASNHLPSMWNDLWIFPLQLVTVTWRILGQIWQQCLTKNPNPSPRFREAQYSPEILAHAHW